MSRPLAPLRISEELAQTRNVRLILFYLAQSIEQRDRQIADQLARVIAGQAQLDLRLSQVAALVEQAACENLDATGFVVQANEVLRRVRDEVHAVPGAVVATLAQAALPRQAETGRTIPLRHITSADDDLVA